MSPLRVLSSLLMHLEHKCLDILSRAQHGWSVLHLRPHLVAHAHPHPATLAFLTLPLNATIMPEQNALSTHRKTEK